MRYGLMLEAGERPVRQDGQDDDGEDEELGENLYLVENGVNIVLAIALVHPLGVRGLALSLSIAYTVAALLALAVFRRWFGHLADREAWSPLGRVLVASVPMAVVVLVVSNLSGSTSTVELLARVLGAVAAGGVTFGRRSSSGWVGVTTRGGHRHRRGTVARPLGAPRGKPRRHSACSAGPPVADSLHARRRAHRAPTVPVT